MSSIQSTSAWKQLSGLLEASVDRDLEVALLPLLRAFWPGLVRPRGLGHFDKAGCDLVAHDEADGLEVVIQCKGFFATEGIGDSQLAQILKSIARFQKSQLRTGTYILVHNRDGRNREAAAAIDAALQGLVDAGRARSVLQWDRMGCLRALEQQLRETIEERLRAQSERLLDEMDALFECGSDYVEAVPVRQGRLRLKPNQPARFEPGKAPLSATGLAARLASPRAAQWTLLIGLFGTGKTSAALHAARANPREVIYVPAAHVEPRRGEVGTNVLMSRITEALHLFDDFAPDERVQFQRLSGPVLRGMLSAQDSGKTLIIDALDENRGLASADEITRFASTLTELRCRVVLTTREEHFRATFANFDHLFSGLSRRGGGVRDIAVLEVQAWTAREVGALAASAAARHPGCIALERFRAAIAAGEATGWPEALVRHPFFLRMIVDLLLEGAEPARNRAGLLADWTWAKLRRDLRTDRATPVPVTDLAGYLDDIDAVHCAAARAMVAEAEGELRLVETIGSEAFMALVSERFAVRCNDLAAAIGTAFVSPVTVRYRGAVALRFTHRAFQEYYLARALVADGAELAPYPPPVRRLAGEMTGMAPA